MSLFLAVLVALGLGIALLGPSGSSAAASEPATPKHGSDDKAGGASEDVV